jgi:2-amino-4-hydroxy-6-hydroxymethyldihydropteridine diphosphokinase
MTEVACIALGSNLGDRRSYLELAREAIARLEGTRIIATSDIEETAPFGEAGQGPYLNQMVAVETSLTPSGLLAALQEIEVSAGRRPAGVKWGPRTLDLDIVTFGDRNVNESGLTVPHPGLADRDFWQREIEQLRGSLQ